MIWWLENTVRARSERLSVADLTERVNWLQGVRWHLSNGAALAVDFEIEHDEDSIPFTMTYAEFHPNAPPIVVPRGCNRRLSSHQYGAGGNLCLEYRADNWETTVTGAMMIESAHRLIAGERDVDGPELPSAHYVSIGQSVRGSYFRFLITPPLEERLKAIEPAQSIEIGIAEKYHAETFAVTVAEIDGTADVRAWPAGIRETTKRGHAIRLPAGRGMPSAAQDSIASLLGDLGFEALQEQVLAATGEIDLVLVSATEIAHFYAYDSNQKRYFGRSRILKVGAGSRLPDDYAGLAEKSVGIVGCGSLGSKIAAMLARVGVCRFTLVDDDVLFMANLVRNELSVPGIGVHKVDALRARLIEIAGTIEVTTRRVALGGQESADSTDSVMSALQACDVIIDATANAHCFNFCAAVARESLKPLVWGEVFAGGIGGLVARVRSGHEPEPQTARNQINAWCDAHGILVPLAGFSAPYATTAGDGAAALVADDAEVAIIAGHLARLATDLLIRPDNSAFPSPAYAVGLRKAWIFSEPFETWPIQLSSSEPWKVDQDSASVAESLALLRELLPSVFDGHDQSPK
jgi:molybdopterin/thiamine biosynthesis adenylyltransferase